MDRLPTITDVARAAGVHTSTASRVLRGEGTVSDETRARIIEAAREIQYRPSRMAQALRSRGNRFVGLVVDDFHGVQLQPLLLGAQRMAARAGYTLLLEEGEAGAERLAEARVEGVAVVGLGSSKLDSQLTEWGMPCASYSGCFVSERIDPTDEFAASLDAFRLLERLGHRRVAILGSPGNEGQDSPFRRAAAEAGKTNFNRLLGLGPKVLEREARNAAEARLQTSQLVEHERPTAYVVRGDDLTPGVLRALAEAGVEVGTHVSLITVGDSDWARAHTPALSAIRHDEAADGALAIAHLLRSLGRDMPVGPSTSLHWEFIARKSCAPPQLLPECD